MIEERAVRELPLNGRNFATLVYLAPGVTAGQVGENLSGASTFNPRGASNFNALGSQANTNAWLVDGIDNNEFTFNTVIVQPTVESVREFKVLTGTFSAEFGRGAGVVSVSTKSGSNEWHGTAFEYLRNEKFDAKNFFALPTAKKAPLDRHQFGGALSGPIVKNKTFFFVDYAGIKEDRGQVFVNTVPTEAARRGDFSNYRDRNGNLIPIYDPLTTRPNPNGSGVIRDPFPGNVIPADRLDQVGLNVASIYPLPQRRRQLRQLHLDREPHGARPLLHRPHRPPRGRPRQLLRALRLREVLAGRAPGPGRLLPGNARGGGGPLRPRSLRGGDPEHAPHHPRRGLQLDPPLRAERRQRASPRVRQDQPRDAAVGLRARGRHQPRHPGHQRERVRLRPAQPQHPGRDGHLGRAGLPAREPEADPLPVRGHGLVGDGAALAQDRLPLHPQEALALHQHQHPQQHRDQPQPDQQPADQQPGLRPRHPAPRLHHGRPARLPARRLRLHELGALALRAGRLEAEPADHRSTWACATRSTFRTPSGRTACRTTTPRPSSSSTPARTPPTTRTRRRAGATSLRASAWPGT